MTKYRKSVAEKATPAKKQEKKQKTGSDYNPETWTQQFFREKREAEERIRKSEFVDHPYGTAMLEETEGQEKGKGIPDEKGIPACEV